MAVSYGFFNSIDHDRVYDANQMSTYFKGLIGTGVYNTVGNKMQVVAPGGMLVQVKSGRALIGEHMKWIENDSTVDLDINPAHVTLNRWTAVIIRHSVVNRTVVITTKDGSNGVSPQKPPIVNDAEINELCLAYVYVRAGATAITQADITDTRPDNTVCGWITGLISQVDTSTLFAQWEAAYRDVMDEMEDVLAELERIEDIIKLVPLICVTDHNKTVAAGSVITISAAGYTYTSTDLFYLYINGLKVPGNEYAVTGSGANLTITFSGANAPAEGVVYDDIELEVWRPE